MVKRLLLIIAGGVLCIGGANCSDEILDDGLPFPEGIPDEGPAPDDGLPFPEGIQDEGPALDDGLPFPGGYPRVQARTYVLKKGDDPSGLVGGVVDAIRRGKLDRPGPQSVFFCADLMVDANGVYTGGDRRLTNDGTAALMQAIQDIIDLAVEESSAVEPGTEKHTLASRLMFVFGLKPEDVIRLVKNYVREKRQYEEENLGKRISRRHTLREWYGVRGCPLGRGMPPSPIVSLARTPGIYGLDEPSSSSSSFHNSSLPPPPPSSSSSSFHNSSLPPPPPSSSSFF
jgi:hypothetical protein